MASGSSSQGNLAPAGAPPAADDTHLPHQPLNPEFAATPATELVDYLHHHGRMSDFADVVAVLAEHENRLEQAEQLVRAGDKPVDRLLEGIGARNALIHEAAITEARLRTEIHALQQSITANAKPHAGHGLMHQAVPARGELGDVVPRKRPYRALTMSASRDENAGDTTSNMGEVGGDKARHRSLRINPSPGIHSPHH